MLFLVHQARLQWLISKLFVMQLMSKTGALQHMSFYSLLKQLVKVHFKHIFHTWNWCEIWFLYISTPKAKSDCYACAALNLHGNLTSTPTTHYLSQIKNREQEWGKTCLSGHLVIHISTLLVITLAVLPTCHLPFAAPALLVAAATFTRTLKEEKPGS